MICLLPWLLPAAQAEAPFEPDVTVRGVQEACLEGRVDGGQAAARVAAEDLSLLDGEQALARLCAFQSRFAGVRFQELVLSLAVDDGSGSPAWYLVEGATTVRAFAWVERRRNHSPYSHLRRRATLTPAGLPGEPQPADVLFRLYVPAAVDGQRAWFDVQLLGPVRALEAQSADTVDVSGAPTLQAALGNLGFRGSSWAVATDRVHSRSELNRQPPTIPGRDGDTPHAVGPAR